MKPNFIVDIEEKNRILEMHISEAKKNKVLTEGKSKLVTSVQNKLISKGYKLPKFGADGVMGKETKIQLAKYQKANGLKPTGKIDKATIQKLGVSVKPEKTDVKKQTSSCVGISPEACSKISSSSEVELGKAGVDGCAAYLLKALGSNIIADASAWSQLPNLTQKGGTQRYNMFLNGINWDGLQAEITKNKITKEMCSCHSEKGGHKDGKCKDNGLPKIMKNIYPSSSGVNLGTLKPGDVVGLYWSGSHNFGKAFCQRVGDLNSIKSKPFTFNSHVGFVTSVINGVPIIVHNVDNTVYATPGNQLLSKSGRGMIVWAVSTPLSQEKNSEDMSRSKSDTSWWDDIKNWFS